MIHVYNDKADCSGCGLCKIICPLQAIEMKEDEEGFLYPIINQDRCINCGLCQKKCPFTHFKVNKENNLDVRIFACKSKDNRIREKSTSGGMFTVLSDEILKQEGVVYGAVCDLTQVIHKRAVSPEQRDKQRDSKYVQSNILNIFNQIQEDLISKKPVLVTGTPCQIHAINSFCSENRYLENLYLCDVVCNGVGSPLIYREHIKYLEKKYNVKIDNICFRSKSLGWDKKNKRYIKCQTKEKVILDDEYYRLYFNYNVISRPCCERCPYTSIIRSSDLTIGDFWGIDKIAADFDDSFGISLVMTHSEKGNDLLRRTLDDINYFECTSSDAIKENPRVISPSHFGKNRNEFWELHEKMKYDQLLNFYLNTTILGKIRRKFYRLTKR